MALQNQFGLGSQIYPTNSMLNLQTNNTLVNEQRIIKVDGIDGAYKCALPYNTREILITDLYKPIVYLVTTDGINRMVNAFNITPVETQQNQNINQVADVKQDQNNDQVAEALTAINTRLTEMEEIRPGRIFTRLKSRVPTAGREHKHDGLRVLQRTDIRRT